MYSLYSCILCIGLQFTLQNIKWHFWLINAQQILLKIQLWTVRSLFLLCTRHHLRKNFAKFGAILKWGGGRGQDTKSQISIYRSSFKWNYKLYFKMVINKLFFTCISLLSLWENWMLAIIGLYYSRNSNPIEIKPVSSFSILQEETSDINFFER